MIMAMDHLTRVVVSRDLARSLNCATMPADAPKVPDPVKVRDRALDEAVDTRDELKRAMGVASRRWINGQHLPSADELVRMAQLAERLRVLLEVAGVQG